MMAYPIAIDRWVWFSIPAVCCYLFGLKEFGRWLLWRALGFPDNIPWGLGAQFLTAIAAVSGSLLLVGTWTSGLPVAGRISGVALLLLGAASAPRSIRHWQPRHNYWHRALFSLLLIVGAVLTLAALCPPTKADELSYHLPFLERALRDGRFIAYPSPVSAIQPLAIEIVALPLLLLGFTATPALLSLSAIPLMGILFLSECRRRKQPTSFCIPVLVLLLLTPWAVVWGISPGNDTWCALSLAIGTCYAITALHEESFLPVFALCAASATLIKSSSIVPAAAMAAFIFPLALSKGRYREIVIGCGVAFLCVLPYALRSYRDWGVFSPDPLYLAAHLRHLDAPSVLAWIDIKRTSDTFWPRTIVGLWRGPFWVLSHKDGLLGVAVGPGFLVGAIIGVKGLTRRDWLVVLSSFIAGVCAVTYLLPQMPRYYGGTLIAIAFLTLPHATEWIETHIHALTILAAGYTVLMAILLGPYIWPFLRFVLGHEPLAPFLEPRIELAEARLLLSAQPDTGGAFTNLRQLSYVGRPMQLLEGGSVLGRSSREFATAGELAEFMLSHGYGYLLWGGPTTGIWTDLAESSDLLYDRGDAVLQGTRQYGAWIRGRGRVFRLKSPNNR